ncbi:uncharacterized protein LOC129793555 [Lutzomyia longipalpis]|uniref:uncharacterized protein LOC129793555 n=1 Tax=Lutzomyia longipalpis TaxID=7200 RepID=UPI0024841EC7|nr:uncharacterized protein LOC129793555 [Lutzomyia longipalpis]
MPHFKRRSKKRALYYHSSPPKVLGMSIQLAGNVGQDPPPKEVFNIKPSNIRIWIHDKDIPKLTKVLWAGQGMKLRSEISTHPRMRKFLESVPYILNVIKEIHTACIDNDVEYLMKRTAHPMPPIVLSTKDQNGLTALHKAAGLAHVKCVEYLLSIWPEAAMDVDDTGKLPLHWAAAAKNNERSFNLLVQAGADETATDNKMKAAEYYKQRPQEMDKSLLTVIPEAPRIAHTMVPDFDWSIITEARKWGGIQTRASLKKSTSLILDTATDKSTALDGRRGVLSEKASFSVISRNGSLSSDNIDTNTSDDPTNVTTPETVEVNGVRSESELQSAAIPEEDEMPGNLHEAAARTVASVAPSAIFARNTEANTKKRPPTPHYRVIEDNFANGSSNAATTTESDANEGEEEDEAQKDLVTSQENDDGTAADGMTNSQNTDTPLTEVEAAGEEEEVAKEVDDADLATTEVNEKVDEEENEKVNEDEKVEESEEKLDEKSLEGTETETILASGEVNNNDEGSEMPNDEEKTSMEEEQSPTPPDHTKTDEEAEESVEKEALEVQEEDELQDGDKTPGGSTVADSINREPSAEYDEVRAVSGGKTPVADEEQQEKNDDQPGGVMEIEGIVQGEPATGQQSEGGNLVDDDEANQEQMEKIKLAIEGGDMEYLAAVVLNGEGRKLMGLETKQAEIQAFLDNVPAYMGKIRRVHTAAREGNLRDLQSALDRRKFAIAKDEISPNGATPLHVATVFGHTGIIRYLAGRFPETMTAVDEQKRTALHYAATIHDNGHFYNLLVHMGANPKAQDEEGNTAEFYMLHDRSENILSHKMLLRNFGVQEEMADEMLNDQVPDDVHSARRLLDDADILSTLERCFKVIHDTSRASSIAEMPARNSIPGSRTSARVTIVSNLARFLKRNVFDVVKLRQTKLDHNLFDIIWPAMKKTHQMRLIDDDADAGVVIPDFDCYVVFREFLVPLIKDIHCLDVSQNLKPHPTSSFFPAGLQDNTAMEAKTDESNLEPEALKEIHLNLDPAGKWIRSTLVECCRNLEVFELPLNLTVAQLEHVERILTGRLLSRDFSEAIGEETLGQYYSMNEVLENPSEIRTMLSAYGLLIPLLDPEDSGQLSESMARNGQYWPYGRGVYVSASNDFVAWINCQEHLRILCCTQSEAVADIGIAFSKVGRAVQFLDAIINFRNTYYLGNLTARPSYLGTGLRLSYNISLPHLMKESDNLRHLCATRSLQMSRPRTHLLQSGMIRLSNKQSLGLTEWRLFIDFCTAAANILQLEKDLSLTNTKHIATMFVNIFRKKKHSLAEAAATNN